MGKDGARESKMAREEGENEKREKEPEREREREQKRERQNPNGHARSARRLPLTIPSRREGVKVTEGHSRVNTDHGSSSRGPPDQYPQIINELPGGSSLNH